jgi:hypothetical protein
VRSLTESSHLAGERGRYRLMTKVEKLPVPDTVQALLAARIDRLPERQRRVLQTAAVIGKDVRGPILERVADVPAAALMCFDEQAWRYSGRAWARIYLGEVAEVITDSDRGLELAGERNDFDRDVAQMLRSMADSLRGDVTRALEHARRHMTFAEKLGGVTNRIHAWVGLGQALSLAGHWQEATLCSRKLARLARGARQAHCLYQDMGATGHAERVARLLAADPA